MENMDRALNKLIRDKCDMLIGENYYKRKRIHIDFTKSNRINTIERIEAIYSAFDKVLRNILKAVLSLEKNTRITKKVPMSDDRKEEIKSILHNEVDGILNQMEKECRANYQKLGKIEEFERKWETSRSTIKSNIDSQTQKAKDDIDKKINK